MRFAIRKKNINKIAINIYRKYKDNIILYCIKISSLARINTVLTTMIVTKPCTLLLTLCITMLE